MDPPSIGWVLVSLCLLLSLKKQGKGYCMHSYNTNRRLSLEKDTCCFVCCSNHENKTKKNSIVRVLAMMNASCTFLSRVKDAPPTPRIGSSDSEL